MGDPGDVPTIEAPSWVGEKIGGPSAEDLVEAAADWSAAGTDVGGAFGVSGPDIPGVGVSVGDMGGGILTGVAQARASSAQTLPGKIVDGVAAGAADIGLGAGAGAVATAVGLSSGVGAVAIVVDKAVETVADKVFDTPGVSVAASVNGAIRGAVAAAEDGIRRDTTARADFTSKAESGKFGAGVKWVVGMITGRKG